MTIREDEDKVFDKRIVERNIENGAITEEDYQEYLESLEDASDNAAPIEAEFEVGVLEDDEEPEDTAEAESAETDADDEEASD